MRASEVRRVCVFFRTAVEAVRYGRIPGKEVALADLDAQLARFREQGDWQVTGCDVPTSFVLLVVAAMRLWSRAPTDMVREALTDCTMGLVNTLAKWIDGELFSPEPAADYWQNIGG